MTYVTCAQISALTQDLLNKLHNTSMWVQNGILFVQQGDGHLAQTPLNEAFLSVLELMEVCVPNTIDNKVVLQKRKFIEGDSLATCQALSAVQAELLSKIANIPVDKFVNGLFSYDSINKVLVLNLSDGSKANIPLADLFAQLYTEFQRKLKGCDGQPLPDGASVVQCAEFQAYQEQVQQQLGLIQSQIGVSTNGKQDQLLNAFGTNLAGQTAVYSTSETNAYVGGAIANAIAAIPNSANTERGLVALNQGDTLGDDINSTNALTAIGMTRLAEGNVPAGTSYSPQTNTAVSTVQTAIARAVTAFIERTNDADTTRFYNALLNQDATKNLLLAGSKGLSVELSSDSGNLLQSRSGKLYYGIEAPPDTANIYVNASTGVDTNPGTEALPVKTFVQAARLGPAGVNRNIYFFAGQTHALDQGPTGTDNDGPILRGGTITLRPYGAPLQAFWATNTAYPIFGYYRVGTRDLRTVLAQGVNKNVDWLFGDGTTAFQQTPARINLERNTKVIVDGLTLDGSTASMPYTGANPSASNRFPYWLAFFYHKEACFVDLTNCDFTVRTTNDYNTVSGSPVPNNIVDASDGARDLILRIKNCGIVTKSTYAPIDGRIDSAVSSRFVLFNDQQPNFTFLFYRDADPGTASPGNMLRATDISLTGVRYLVGTTVKQDVVVTSMATNVPPANLAPDYTAVGSNNLATRVTGNFTVTTTDGIGYVHLASAAANVTGTIPAANVSKDRRISFTNNTSYAITLNRTYRGDSTNYTQVLAGSSVVIVSDGTDWFQIADA